MTPILNLVLRATRQVNEYIIQSIDKRDPNATDQSADKKLVEHVESVLFNTLFDTLKRGYPNHYLAEPGETLLSEKEDSWHISGFNENVDAFVRRLPSATYSIAHRNKGKVVNAIICNPFTGDEYTSSRGGGSSLNNRRIRCSQARSLSESYVSSNLLQAVSTLQNGSIALNFLGELSQNSQQALQSGNASLDLAMVAANQIDAAILVDSPTETLEAALLICQEAGALSGTLGGAPLNTNGRKSNIVIANPKLYKSTVQRFGGYDKKLTDSQAGTL